MSCLCNTKQAKIAITLNINISTIIVFTLTYSVSVNNLDSGDPMLITKVNRPPGPVGHVTLLGVGAVSGIPTVFLYPVHCLG